MSSEGAGVEHDGHTEHAGRVRSARARRGRAVLPPDVAISVEGLGKRFRIGARLLAAPPVGGEAALPTGVHAGDLWALRDVGFTVRRGETVGVLGRNGAGKSTLLKVIARVTDPSEGRVAVAGHVGSLLEVAAGFHPDLTGRDNILMVGSILGMRRRETLRRFDEIVGFSEVGRFLDVPVRRFSSGMYLRLAFSVAAHLDASVLLVDEALAVGDHDFREKCLRKMRSLASEGRTVLFVSHDRGSIDKLCRRSIVLERGRLVFDGPTSEALSAYAGLLHQTRPRHEATARPDRPTITRVELVDASPSAIRPGDPLALAIDVAVPAAFVAPHAPAAEVPIEVVAEIVGSDLWPLTGSRHRLRPAAGVHRLECHVPAIRLGPGRYTFSVSLHAGSEEVDSVMSTCPVTVEPPGAATGPAGTGARTGAGWRYIEQMEWREAGPVSPPAAPPR